MQDCPTKRSISPVFTSACPTIHNNVCFTLVSSWMSREKAHHDWVPYAVSLSITHVSTAQVHFNACLPSYSNCYYVNNLMWVLIRVISTELTVTNLECAVSPSCFFPRCGAATMNIPFYGHVKCVRFRSFQRGRECFLRRSTYIRVGTPFLHECWVKIVI